ncbi:MAG TPA: nicotinate-nucleotide adenylyltransferase [Candidatus Acidoferrales bacterium]|nr:nicotinate-nucleotide adenylyltransferase [Candidatus Acidoferrales bacterium]
MTPRSSPKNGAIALFGGAFDPIHMGHLAVARVACRQFHLDSVHFIPSGRPPHKTEAALSPFEHRYAMVALACAGHRRFVPSLAEADISGPGRFFYTIDTVRRYQRQRANKQTALYFITGADAFLQISTWKEYRALLETCDFIVAHRPGFRLDALAEVIPPDLLAGRPPRGGDIALRRTTVHLLRAVSSGVSSTEIRRRCRQGRAIRGLVAPPVGEYIDKQALYRG